LIKNENTSCLVTGLHLLYTLGCLLVMLMWNKCSQISALRLV
jgi:hypothetical protein